MEIYSIGLASDCQLDDDFFDLLEMVAQKKGLATYRVYPYNLEETLLRIHDKQIRFLAFYDRASDTSSQFLKIYSAISDDQILYFTDLDQQTTSSDKSVMHKYFVRNKINVPKTVIITEFAQQQYIDLIESDLDILGRPFVIKPSVHTGAGSGVYLNGYTLTEVEEKRKEFPKDKYLIQEKIYPKEIYLKRFWFRAFYICGSIITTWWNDYGHQYEPLSNRDLENIDVNQIEDMMKKIHNICRLNFFSTELAITGENNIYAIDYVNEICDMRLQSKHCDGIPDDIVKYIAERIVKHIGKMIPVN
jgi:hypothetical protein